MGAMGELKKEKPQAASGVIAKGDVDEARK